MDGVSSFRAPLQESLLSKEESMKYRNKKTGIVIDTPCKIQGDLWERVNDSGAGKKKSSQKPEAEPQEEGKKK